MKLSSVRKMTALVFALFVAGGSLASAAGARDYGERCVERVTAKGGAADFGE